MPTETKKFLAALALFVALVGASGAALYTIALVNQLPPLDQFDARKVSQSTKLYDRTGTVLLYEIFGDEKRTILPFDKIPEFVKQATLTAEDADFYHQPAFDWKGIIRAIFVNLRSGEVVQGGSTITQQLVKNVFLTPEKTITRKLKELILAIKLEQKYGKDEILDAYLNQIPYGSNVYGIEEASQLYFGISATDLTLGEAAVLAALPKAPSYYSPWGDHRDELLERKDYILQRMVELGFVTDAAARAAAAEDIVFQPEPSLGKIRAPHFSLFVKNLLIERYGEDMALRGGLRVVTTLDWDLQQAAEDVVARGAARNEELYDGRNAALVAEDPRTGQVLSLVGSRNYLDDEIDGKFNVPVQGLRQPGSALKPFAYLTAFEKGYAPGSVIFDTETEFTAGSEACPALVTPASDENTDCFNPDNFDGVFRGPVTFEEGLAQSINVPSVKVLYLAGLGDTLDTLHQFGITTLQDKWRYGLSLVLGGGEVRLVDLVNAYATLANEGVRHTQSFILRVEDADGNVIDSFSDSSARVAPANPVRMINHILSDVALRSGLFQASLGLTVFPGHEVALKTGTTNDYRDAWTFGYTPRLVVGVWAGNNNNDPMHRQGSSILAAVPLWSEFMKQALALDSAPAEPFTRPDATPLPAKPMLNGETVYLDETSGAAHPELHSILYWVDRSDPLGPAPKNPYTNPQFYNWEEPVGEWALQNIPNFASAYNTGTVSGFVNGDGAAARDISIAISNPKNGSFVSKPIIIQATVQAARGIRTVSLAFNGTTVDTQLAQANTYRYLYLLNQDLAAQNVLQLTVTDETGAQRTSTRIVFKE